MYFRTADVVRRARDSSGLTLNWRKSSPQDRILSLSQSLSEDAHIVEDPEEPLVHIVRRGLASLLGLRGPV